MARGDLETSMERVIAADPKRHFLGAKMKMRTHNLFVEHCFDKDLKPLYTLKDFTYRGYPSLKKLYLEERDPTGYLFSHKYLYNYEHLLILKATKMIGHHIEAWERELEMLLEAENLQRLSEMAASTNPKYVAQSTSAAKFLASKGWRKDKKGRPSKSEVDGERKRQAEVLSIVQDDLDRING